jgi:hypothetical protein
LFISIFALDVFGEGTGFWQTVFALFLHLIPTFIIIVTLVLAWRWEWIGAVVYSALGVLYIVMLFGRFPLSVYFVIAGPLFCVGILFLLNWMYRKKLKSVVRKTGNS